MPHEHVDVLILGAGLSGIGAAVHLIKDRPGTSYLVLEQRERIGGTWDLFRYPGVRSDSDMYTLGYNFKPWNDTKILAEGSDIRGYVEQTAAEHGVIENIRFGRRIIAADWSTDQQRWTVTVQRGSRTETYTARFVIAATGYYSYESGYRPQFPGEERFTGRFVHPQDWPEDLDHAGKRVVVIGSGATAVTLVPAMAETAAHVTMVQRTPTYVVSLPSNDVVSATLRRVMPRKLVYKIARTRNIAVQRAFYMLSKSQPAVAKRVILAAAKRQLGDVDIKHFTPPYNPWDQRLCVVPNGDLFKVLRNKRATVITDRIKTFTETGIELESGAEIGADIVVTATGLQVQLFGGAAFSVDGEAVQAHEHVLYKGVLMSGLPNFAMIIGYTNASWTLKADIAAKFIVRLLRHMDKKGYTQVVPRPGHDVRSEASIMGSLDSGYVRRADQVIPRQGTEDPWRNLNNYLQDAPVLKHSPLEDGHLRFSTHQVVARVPRVTPEQVAAQAE
jgi:cation diffusion facilitator CzcD-associated flavoprotein CzcO